MAAGQHDGGRQGDRRRRDGGGDAGDLIAHERRRGDRRNRGLKRLVALFNETRSAELEAILAGCPVRGFGAEEVLLHPGEHNTLLFIVLAGSLAVKLDPQDPAPVHIDPGDCVGEMSIIDGEPASAYVIATAGTRLLVVDEAIFWQRIVPLPGVARNLMRAQTRRMRQGNQAMLAKMHQQLQLIALERDLAAAAEIQRGLLPRDFATLCARPQLEVHGLMRPAREIGGDFYDAFFIGESRLFFAVGDVSDKGIAAALFMARSLTLLRAEALHADSPLAVIEGVNRALCQDNPKSMFVTLICGSIDLADGRVTLAHGGHPPPLRLAGAVAQYHRLAGRLRARRDGQTCLSLKRRCDSLPARPCCSIPTVSPKRGMPPARCSATNCSGWRLPASAQAVGRRPSQWPIRDAVDAFATGVEPFDDLTLLALRYQRLNQPTSMKLVKLAIFSTCRTASGTLIRRSRWPRGLSSLVATTSTRRPALLT